MTPAHIVVGLVVLAALLFGVYKTFFGVGMSDFEKAALDRASKCEHAMNKYCSTEETVDQCIDCMGWPGHGQRTEEAGCKHDDFVLWCNMPGSTYGKH